MEEMRALGAPALPDEHYYHIRSSSYGGVYVSIRKERKYVWDKTVVEISAARWSNDDANVMLSPDEVVHNGAHKAYKIWTEKTPEQLWWSEFRHWEGDHK